MTEFAASFTSVTAAFAIFAVVTASPSNLPVETALLAILPIVTEVGSIWSVSTLSKKQRTPKSENHFRSFPNATLTVSPLAMFARVVLSVLVTAPS